MDDDSKLPIRCINCRQLNSIPSDFKSGRAQCQKCGEYLQNPARKDEIEGYNEIKIGISAVIIFCIILLIPHVSNLAKLTISENDSESDGSSDEIKIETCDPESSKYNPDDCLIDIASAANQRLIFESLGHVSLYLLLLFGLSQIFIGTSKVAKFHTSKF